jgi:hypothetical protein
MTGDHGAVSVRDIDEQVHTKIFISEIVEKEQHYIRDSPKALTESTIHIYTYLNSNQLYERCRVFESARIVWVSWCISSYVIERFFSLTLIIDDMKRIYKKVFKSTGKKPSLGSIHGPGPATSTSTLITSSTDLMPSIPASDATASAQVTAGVSVSV